MASMGVSVPDSMRDWVQRRIESGQYARVTEYVCDPIRRHWVQTDEYQALVGALLERELTGVCTRRVPSIIAALKGELRSKADEPACSIRSC